MRKDRKRAKLAITKWVKRFREENGGKNPTDEHTQPIAMELADYNHVNMQYMEIKMAMIKQEKMPFEAESFFNPDKTASNRPGSRTAGAARRQSLLKKQTDRFMATLSQGFGAAASKGRNDSQNMQGTGVLSNGANSTREKIVNYFEIRCNEL